MLVAGLTVLLAVALTDSPPSSIPKTPETDATVGAPDVTGDADDIPEVDGPAGSSSGAGGAPPTNPPGTKRAEPVPSTDQSFRWVASIAQAATFTAVMHAHRFAIERGTRDAVRGPFLKDYFDSVAATRGWDDADGFHVSYVGHPMEGAVFAFIQIQNDPAYRELRFNEGRNYWISRLRATAFSAVWSTLWTLGPVSEASLGNAQLYASPGLIDVVVTPSLGIGWAIGEDAIDRYLIERLEQRTANRLLLMLVRGIGNPTRTFANLMGFRRPWQRDTRPGLFGSDFVARSESIRVGKAEADSGLVQTSSSHSLAAAHSPAPTEFPKEAPIELQASAHYETFLGGGSCIGGGGQGATRLSPSWQLVAEVSGCLIVNMPTNQSGDSLVYAAGLRWTPRASRRLSPYTQLLLGGRKVTQEIMDHTLHDKLLKEWNDGQLPHFPKRSDYSIEYSANGFALLAGGGMDIKVHPALTVRVASLEYTHSFLPQVDRIDASNGLRVSTGIVLRIGTW